MNASRVNEYYSNEQILDALEEAKTVIFLAKPFNKPCWRRVSFGEVEFGLRLCDLLTLLRVRPIDLKPVFTADVNNTSNEDRSNLWIYNSLCDEAFPSFSLSRKPFVELAKIIGKPIEVILEDQSGSYVGVPQFTAYPSGYVRRSSHSRGP